MPKSFLSGLPPWYYCFVWVLFGVSTACNPPSKTAPNSTAFTASTLPEVVDFNYHIKPILSDRCFKCHGPDLQTREGGLAFNTQEAAFAPLGEQLDHYAIVPGDPDASALVTRIFSTDPDLQMPPPASNLALSEIEKQLLKRWIEQGAQWKPHWAFIPPQKPTPPKVKLQGWAKTEVDQFVLAKMENQGLTPAAPASREKLLRRVSFDLTGLPPSLEAIDAFRKDESPDAFAKIVDQLLASDAYAERMAQDWLDLARYADTHGYQDDFERMMWPWRDWVIDAFRQNMPYDDFVTWQLAGDLLPNPTLAQRIATGFNRNHKITAEGGVIDEEYRVEYVADRAQTFATAFLGLTMECARCHDHKYDPLTQKDYYSLFSFFNNVPEKGLIGPTERAPEPKIKLSKAEIAASAQFIRNLKDLDEVETMVMAELPQPRSAHILRRGAYDAPTTPVTPTTPVAVLPFSDQQNPNRLGLAHWLFQPQHPLTSRVIVNRLWQQLFGRGIVATPFDFGNQGALPSHPELLDYLAVRFREEDWDIKGMLRYLVLSATYQQSDQVPKQALATDPQNMWLSHAPRLRLKAEMIRDQALVLSGLLNTAVGGPSVKPYQPAGIWEETTGGGGGSTAFYVQDTGADLYRRSLYTFWKRTVPPPAMLIYDAASRDLCTVRRQETNTPLQALVLLNDPQIIEASRFMAVRTLQRRSRTREQRITYLFQLVTSREPTSKEIKMLAQLWSSSYARFRENPADAKAYLDIGERKAPATFDPIELAAYTLLANTILNLDESVTRG